MGLRWMWLVVLALAGARAWAQEQSTPEPSAPETVATVPVQSEPAPAPAADDRYSFDNIVVTARKREEPLQDVPVSIAAFTGRQLDDRGVTTLRDLGTYVPGLQFTDLAGYNLVYLRGVGTDAFIPAADPSVATYLDGVYFPSAHSLAQAFGDLERVEVLKGPQGTLFGRNATGGALTLWTREPGPASYASLQAASESFDGRKARVNGNLALGPSLALGVSGFDHQAENIYRLDNGSGAALPRERSRGARARLAFRPNSDIDIVITGLAARQTGTSTTTSANTHPSPGLGQGIPAETRDYVVTADTAPHLSTDTRAYYGRADWRAPWFDTRLLGSNYFVNAYDYVYDFDASSQARATYGAVSDFQKLATAELQFTSNDTTWGSRWLKWVGGLYYLRGRGGYDPGYLRLSDTAALPISSVVPQAPGLADALAGSPLPSQLTFVFTGLIGAKSESAYAQATASVTDWLDLTLGGRWQRETRALLRSETAVGDPQGSPQTFNSYAPRESSVRNFSPKASLDLRPFEGLLAYVSYQRGFKSATYNIINIYAEPDYVKPERVESLEAGVKSDWFDRTLRLNLAAFRNDIDDLQTGFVSFTSGGAINFENAGRARIRGVEAETQWVPLRRWLPGFTMHASGSWLDARYVEYLDGSGYDEQTGLAFGRDNGSGRDFSGNRIVRTPRLTWNAGVLQEFRLPGGPLQVAADYSWNSGYYYLAQNSPLSYEDQYGVIGARVSYAYEPWSLRLSLLGANLGDARYDLAQFHTDFGREDTLAPPRTVGARVEWSF